MMSELITTLQVYLQSKSHSYIADKVDLPPHHATQVSQAYTIPYNDDALYEIDYILAILL